MSDIMRGQRLNTGSNISGAPSRPSKNFPGRRISSSPMSKRMEPLKRRSSMASSSPWASPRHRTSRDLAERMGLQLNRAGFLSDGRVQSGPDLGQEEFLWEGHFGVPGIFRRPWSRVQALRPQPHLSSLLLVLLTSVKEYPAEGALSEEIPKVGVFLCHCGEELKKSLSIPDLIEEAKRLREVVHVEEVGLACLPEDLDLIKRRIGRTWPQSDRHCRLLPSGDPGSHGGDGQRDGV